VQVHQHHIDQGFFLKEHLEALLPVVGDKDGAPRPFEQLPRNELVGEVVLDNEYVHRLASTEFLHLL